MTGVQTCALPIYVDDTKVTGDTQEVKLLTTELERVFGKLIVILVNSLTLVSNTKMERSP